MSCKAEVVISDKVMQLCRGKELHPFPSLYSPFLHFFICQPSIDSLPSPSLRSPSLSTLPSSYLSLPHSFIVPSVVPYIPHSLSTFPFPSQSSPFPPNLHRPYSSSFLPIYFSTYLRPYLSTSLSSVLTVQMLLFKQFLNLGRILSLVFLQCIVLDQSRVGINGGERVGSSPPSTERRRRGRLERRASSPWFYLLLMLQEFFIQGMLLLRQYRYPIDQN